MFVIEDCIIQILRIIRGKKIKFPGVSSKRIKGGLYKTLSNLFSNFKTDKINEMQKLQSYKSMLLHHNCFKYERKISLIENYVQNKNL